MSELAMPALVGTMVGGTTLSAISQHQQGKFQKKLYRAQAAQQEADAAAQRDSAREAARRKRREGRELAARQLVTQAGSGVMAGAGTPLRVMLDDAISIERDAQNISRYGVNAYERGMGAAAYSRAQGSMAARAGTMGAFTTAMTGGANLMMLYGSQHGWFDRKPKYRNHLWEAAW